jgi:hypothetical protein
VNVYVVRINGEYLLGCNERLMEQIKAYCSSDLFVGHCVIFIAETDEIVFETLGKNKD